jgi:hypothetical protein
MTINCLKCGKEILEADIEGKKYYCRSCREWYTSKENAADNSPQKDKLQVSNDIKETNTPKERHIIVSIWLWLSIIGNIAFLIIMLFDVRIYGQRIIDTSEIGGVVVLFSIVLIIDRILILKWKIIGFFIEIVAFGITYYVAIVNDYYYQAVPKMLIAMITLLIYFGILQIRKNGVSTWRHLLNEAKANKRKTKIWFAAVFGSIFVLLLITIFPVKIMYGNIIVMFAPERIARPEYYDGWLFGNHVLKTEHGEIKVKFLTELTMLRGELGIDSKNFEFIHASHDLEVYGIKMPKNITVWIDIFYKRAEISRLGVGKQRLLISGVSVIPDGYIYINYWDGATFPVSFVKESIILADSTEIDVSYFAGDLVINEDSKRWKLVLSGGWFSGLWVKLPGEDEYTRYKSIRFKENWGDFIDGEL